ncbi:MAG: ice-binding family protein [Bacteroidota bacterium]
MKTILFKSFSAVLILLLPLLNFAQAPPLGTAAGFVLFSTVGAVGNTGISQVTGNVGTNNGAITGFGNVNGVMQSPGGASAQCAADLLIACNLLNSAVPAFFPAPLLGNGQVLNAGVYAIPGAATLNLDLTLDAQGNSGAVFIFKIQGPFSTGANAKVRLINGAQACNVFWKVEGLVSMAAGTTMRGTVIANNAAISMSTGDTLEGRALSTSGAVNVAGVMAYTPIGCGSPVLTGPAAPALATAGCFVLLSASGPVTNAGITYATGDIGTNVGLTTGFNPLFVTGTIHPIPDGATLQAAADLGIVYTYLNALPYDIELLYPAQFGRNLVLTPHTYLMNAATTFTDTVYLNAQGNANAVFVIKINGALSTSTYARVILTNGTLAKNVYWKVDGAVSINDYSVFKGTIVCNNGAMLFKTGVNLEGRGLTTTGALGTTAITAIMPPGCGGSASPTIITQPVSQAVCAGGSASFSINASGTSLTYQWKKGSVNLTNGGNISGTTSQTLTINPAGLTNAGSNYNVVVTGAFLPAITSANVSLTVNPSPVPTIGSTNNPCAGSTNNIYYTESGQSNYIWTVTDGIIANGQGTSTLNITWTGTGQQVVTVNYSNSSGCAASAPTAYNLFVNSMPAAAGLITGPPAVCAGASGVVFSTPSIMGVTGYDWTIPAGATITAGAETNQVEVTFGPVAGNDVVTVSGVNGCGSGPLSPDFMIMVNAIPPAPQVSATGNILASSAPAGNQWYFEGNAIAGATGQVFTVTGNSGNYWCSVTLNGCVSDISNKVWVTLSGMKNLPASASFNVYPVPNNGEFTVSIRCPADGLFSILVYDMVGSKVFALPETRTVGGRLDVQIDLRPINDGLYFVVFLNSQYKVIRRIEVQN